MPVLGDTHIRDPSCHFRYVLILFGIKTIFLLYLPSSLFYSENIKKRDTIWGGERVRVQGRRKGTRIAFLLAKNYNLLENLEPKIIHSGPKNFSTENPNIPISPELIIGKKPTLLGNSDRYYEERIGGQITQSTYSILSKC